MSQSQPRFTRASATGNSFIITESSDSTNRSELAQLLCRGYIGFHTDGFIVIDKIDGNKVHWDFYNADGSSAEMCGNGTRCVAQYFLKHQNKKEIMIQTVVGDIQTKIIQDGLVETQMPGIQEVEKKEISVLDEKIGGLFVNSGVPHFVIEGIPSVALAEKLRSHKAFGKSGANITFLEAAAPGKIQAVSYERGVEDFTLSCGTGAVAAAVAHLREHKSLKECSVEMPGGNLLVQWNGDDDVKLIGPAQLEFNFRMEP
jgi:diaminopimelate epimerase